MPNQTGGAGRQPKNYVKQYLKARGVDPNALGPKTYAAVNSLTPQELKVLDTVGGAMEEDGAPVPMRAAMIH